MHPAERMRSDSVLEHSAGIGRGEERGSKIASDRASIHGAEEILRAGKKSIKRRPEPNIQIPKCRENKRKF